MRWFGQSDPRGLAWPVVAPVPGCGRAGTPNEPTEPGLQSKGGRASGVGGVCEVGGMRGSSLGCCPCRGLRHSGLCAWPRPSRSPLRGEWLLSCRVHRGESGWPVTVGNPPLTAEQGGGVRTAQESGDLGSKSWPPFRPQCPPACHERPGLAWAVLGHVMEKRKESRNRR